MSAYKVFLTAAVCVVCISICMGAATGVTSSPSVDELLSKDTRTRSAAIRVFIVHSEELEKSLVSVLHDKEASSERKAHACFLLGYMRASGKSTIQALIASLGETYIDTMKDIPSTVSSPEDALVRIGKPATASLLKVVAQDTSKVRRGKALKVVCLIEGEDVARFLMTKQLSRESNVASKNNLREALLKIDK